LLLIKRFNVFRQSQRNLVDYQILNHPGKSEESLACVGVLSDSLKISNPGHRVQHRSDMVSANREPPVLKSDEIKEIKLAGINGNSEPSAYLGSASGKDDSRSEWGTFKDSLRAPIHNWFTYPAGFSHVAVNHFLETTGAKARKSLVYDPFMGSGTTNIVSKLRGVDSVGIEAHPFVYEITLAKMSWDVELDPLERVFSRILSNVRVPSEKEVLASNISRFPELLSKCFVPSALFQLGEVRDAVHRSKLPAEGKRFLETVLICSLRDVSIAATGWPYIAPKKVKVTSLSKDPLPVLFRRFQAMSEDLKWASASAATRDSRHEIILGDSRHTGVQSNIASHLFTSPPYLNNFDYADRTRLEMYFMGEARSWGEISEKVRVKLMTSATTQINRADSRYELCSDLKRTSPREAEFLEEAIDKLSKLRLSRGGKKSYDMMVSGYFNDIFKVLSESVRILKVGGFASFVLGDSAPYGVHIPTDELIGKIGSNLGFSKFTIEELRTRGGKWSKNPQRHSVPLRESIVHFRK
jgi:hypothetical protein